MQTSLTAHFKATKRKATSRDVDAANKRRKKDSQHALVQSEVKVPLDVSFKVSTGKEAVYIDDSDGMIYDVILNQSNIAKNANKFYRIQIVKLNSEEYCVHTRWGRVGALGTTGQQNPVEEWEALSQFENKFLEKTGLDWCDRNDMPKKGKYTFLQQSYRKDARPDGNEADLDMISLLPGRLDPAIPGEAVARYMPSATCQLIDLIFEGKFIENALEKIGYNQATTPIGKLSTGTILKGYETLTEISNLIQKSPRASNEEFVEASNRYYSLIPHVSKATVRLPVIKAKAMLIAETKMLDELSQLEISAKMKRDVPRASLLSQLELEKVTPLNKHSEEFNNLKTYLERSSGSLHAIIYKVKEIFRVTRKGEVSRFLASKFARLKPTETNRRLLWHGSRTTNFCGILKNGLCIAPPQAPVSGYAFGKGIYFADCSTKSANYCHAGLSGKQGLLLLCEVELGIMKDVLKGTYVDPRDSVKFLSTHGMGEQGPSKWIDAGICVNEDLTGVKMPDLDLPQETRASAYLRYDEYVVYSESQVQIRYLFHVEM